MLVGKRRFENYFSDFKTKGRDLLLTMNSLELFPPRRGDVLKGEDVPDNYASAQVIFIFKIRISNYRIFGEYRYTDPCNEDI
jgi:hypothetical protein